jgi:Lsr2
VLRGEAMQRVEVRLEDDLTGGPADETVKFGLEGLDYEVDLSSRHAAEFRRQLAPFVDRARRVRSQRSRARARTAASRERSREIRAWAEQQGYSVAEHGRLPGNIIHEYDVAHSGQPAERATPRAAGRKVPLDRTASKRQGRAKASRRRRTTPLRPGRGLTSRGGRSRCRSRRTRPDVGRAAAARCRSR